MSHYNTMYSVMALDTLLHFFQELDSLPWGHHTVALVSQIALANLFLCIYYFMFIFFVNKHYFCYSNTASLQIQHVAHRGGYVIKRSTDYYEIVATQDNNNNYILTMVCDL